MNSFNILQKEFEKIKNKGYIKSINNYKNGAGLTLESELGSTGGDFNIPDFMDIEIKSVYKHRDATIELFNSAPDGIHFPAAQWISEHFGYPDRDFKNIKVFKGTIYGNKMCKVGYKYLYKLSINNIKRRLELNIYNNDRLINNDIYWDFDTLNDKLVRKDSKIAVITFDKKTINNKYYYKYEKIYMYELKSFEDFIKLVENGIINVTFKTGVHKSGKYIGKFADHGTSFRIEFRNLHRLCSKYN